jgi:hypothetical protein
MDLTNKTIRVKNMSSNHETNITNVSFKVFEELAEGLFQNVGDYALVLNSAYSGPEDGELLLAIRDKLEALS